ncbi:MAG: hypothetical protein Q7O04_07355 [Candidatus Omnitrophota bacterium]|nr:hypothetical protein [Candidatus Omnitrophota bacterium]
MLKKIIFNIVIIIVLIMIGSAIIKANKQKPGITNGNLNNLQESSAQEAVKKAGLNPKEAKYYRVIEE